MSIISILNSVALWLSGRRASQHSMATSDRAPSITSSSSKLAAPGHPTASLTKRLLFPHLAPSDPTPPLLQFSSTYPALDAELYDLIALRLRKPMVDQVHVLRQAAPRRAHAHPYFRMLHFAHTTRDPLITYFNILIIFCIASLIRVSEPGTM